MLDNLGVMAAIQWLTDFQDRTEIEFKLVLRPTDMVYTTVDTPIS